MCCLPQIAAPQGLDYSSVFRVLIVQFMDARGLDIRALKKSCIHFAQPDGRMIPFESHNLFYRDERAVTLNAAGSGCLPESEKASPAPETTEDSRLPKGVSSPLLARSAKD
ncbi:MAG: hypothetical protein U1F53_05300 [Burkholderiaceae bacterium]